METLNQRMLSVETVVAAYKFQGIEMVAGYAPVAPRIFPNFRKLKQMVDQFKFCIRRTRDVPTS